MTTHRFTINVPNPEPRSVSTELSLRPANAADLRELMLEVPKEELEIESASISLDPCERGERSLEQRLKAHTSVDVHVTVVTQPPADPERGGVTALHLVDERGGKTAGGVMLVCCDPAMAEVPGQEVPAKAPCPVELARGLYTVEVDADPSSPGPATIEAGATVELVAQLTNPGRRRLTGVTAYLEHLGHSDARFTPVAWNVGDLPPGEVFYATWTVSAGASQGSFPASIVVEAEGCEPTRLSAPVRIGPSKEEPRKPKRRRAPRK